MILSPQVFLSQVNTLAIKVYSILIRVSFIDSVSTLFWKKFKEVQMILINFRCVAYELFKPHSSESMQMAVLSSGAHMLVLSWRWIRKIDEESLQFAFAFSDLPLSTAHGQFRFSFSPIFPPYPFYHNGTHLPSAARCRAVPWMPFTCLETQFLMFNLY